MNIVREDRPGGGRFVTEVDGHPAELTFRRDGDTWIAAHTGVPRAIGGRGIGTALVERMVAEARREGVRIVPLCPFVETQRRRHPDWSQTFALRPHCG